MKKTVLSSLMMGALMVFAGCVTKEKKSETMETSPLQQKVEEYAEVALTTDMSVLSEKEKQMLPLLFEVAGIMEDIYWTQSYGDKTALMAQLSDPYAKAFVKINYGPWERLNANKPFIEGVGNKPKGAGFYPQDMTKEEFDKIEDPSKTSLYTLIQRDENKRLKVVPYHEAYKEQISKAADLLKKAAQLAEDAGLKKYLELRAEALLTDEYYESDMAWMEMKNNTIDFVVGPIENYEDQLYGYKAAHESFILVKDKEWSKRLDHYSALLPALQKGLPCKEAYKAETPGSDSDLGAYDAVFYAGDCNAGSKTIAINLPNDEKVREDKGSRKLQLKNSMRAKFDKILVPISEVVIAKDQRKHISFDAFFENTMFHEVSHGLGMGNTIDGKQTVREALKDYYTSIEEGKADILGLWAVTKLHDMGEMKEEDVMDNFVTFMAGIFRSVRFGAASAHGKANMVRFNYFLEKEAFSRDEATGTYRVDFEKMKQAMLDLSEQILVIQGDGDYAAAKAMVDAKGKISPMLQKDLDRIAQAGIPRDIVFKQGKDVLGL